MTCSALLSIAAFLASAQPVPKTGSLTVHRPTMDEEPTVVMVSLYRNGELIRTRELLKYQGAFLPSAALLGVGADLPKFPDRSSVTWKNLPEGTYDVRFEAKGFIPTTKRVRVSHEDGDELAIWIELDKEPAKPQPKKREGKGERPQRKARESNSH